MINSENRERIELNVEDFFFIYDEEELGEIYILDKFQKYKENYLDVGVSPELGFFDREALERIEDIKEIKRRL